MVRLHRYFFTFLVLTSYIFTIHIEAKNPSRTCRICEDVAQTYHDAYQCAGTTLDLSLSSTTDNSLAACHEPVFSCDRLAGDVSQACQTMEKSFIEDDSLAKTLWLAQSEYADPYSTCVTLEKCDPDPNPRDLEYTLCHSAFLQEQTRHDFLNSAFTKNCTEQCYLCGWLVKEWPLFQEICTPDGVNFPNSIDPDRTVVKALSLENMGTDAPPSSSATPASSLLDTTMDEEEGEDVRDMMEQDGEEDAAGLNEEEGEALDEDQSEQVGEDPSFLSSRTDSEEEQEVTSSDQDMMNRMHRKYAKRQRRQQLPARQNRRRESVRDIEEESLDEATTDDESNSEEQPSIFLETGSITRVNNHNRLRAWTRNHQQGGGVLQQDARPLQRYQSQQKTAPSSMISTRERIRSKQPPSSTPPSTTPPSTTTPPSASTDISLPTLTGTDLKSDCFSTWRYFSRSRRAKYFSSFKTVVGTEITPADLERSNMWDANVVCKCLGMCALEPFENLGLIQACKYEEKERVMMEYAFPKPH